MRRKRQRRPRETVADAMARVPYRQLRNRFPPIEVMDQDAVERIHRASMEILEETGLRIDSAEARSLLNVAGFLVDNAERRVRFDRAGLMELVEKAPSRASVRGVDRAKRVCMGEGDLAIAAVGGPAFASDGTRGRRPGNREDMCDFIRLTHQLNILHLEGGCSVEPTDLPVETRHLDFYLACCTLTDKPWKPLSVGRERARDAIEMAKIAHNQDLEDLIAEPVFFVNTNTNTPLVLDTEIADGLLEFARAGQPICVTPFALSGAMAPVTLAGALALQNAETLALCGLVQLARPGCPYVYGSFVSNVDMRTGSPAFGTPEYTLAAQASGQLARRYGLPWRSSNVNASNAPDVQAAYESQMAIWGAVTGHASVLNQGAGWLEGGLVASYEKLIIDAEMLQMMAVWMDGFPIDDDAMGLQAIANVGPGGHFFATAHTLERYDTAFYQPVLSDWSNFENWHEAGARDATVRAHEIWQDLLAAYQPPPIDPAIREELQSYVARRKEEIEQLTAQD